MKKTNEIQASNLQKLPSAPKTLSVMGKKKWREFGKEMIEMQIVDKIDLHFLERLCAAYDRLASAEHTIDEQGEYCQSENGGMYLHPAVSMVCNAEKQIERYIQLLGLTRKIRVGLIGESNPKSLVSRRTRRNRGPKK